MNKKLQRSRNHRIMSGVCGGLGEYFDIDPIIFRFGFVALLLAGGSSIIIYLILLIVVPKEPLVINANYNENSASSGTFDNFQQQDLGKTDDADNSNRTIFGLILICGGAFLLLNNLVKAFNIEKLWPAILVIIGLGLLFQKPKKDNNPNL